MSYGKAANPIWAPTMSTYVSDKLAGNGDRSKPSNVQIEPVTPFTLPSYRRIITLLLPIRYPDKFYKDTIANTSESSLSRAAVWLEEAILNNPIFGSPTAHCERGTVPRKVIGGIQCRVEQNPSVPEGEHQLYVQTIGVLAPYRQLGIATRLLEEIIMTVVKYHENVTSIYAHVWEANTDALEWYTRRGFSIESGVIEGYYRRLKPSGARIVRRKITIADHLAAQNPLGNSITRTDEQHDITTNSNAEQP